MSEDLAVVSHEQNGRILSGVGASAEDLAATMDRHTPEDAQVEPTAPPPAAEAKPAAPTPVPAATVEPSQPEKAPTRGQKRFADLTREREDARREAAALKAELDALKARPASPAAPAASVQPSVAAPPAPKPAPTRTKPTEDEIGAKYQSYADFVEDLADWKVEQRQSSHNLDAQIRTAIEADRASRSFQDTVSGVLDAGRKAFTDFDAVRATADVPFSADLLKTILAMAQPAHVIYRLAKDRDLAVRVATSDPYTAGLLLAQLVIPDARPASSGPPSVTPPPAPYQPVQGGRATTVTPSADRAKGGGFDFDKSGYREARAAERARFKR